MHFPASWQTLAKETPADIPLLSCSSIVKFCCLRNKSALYDLGAGLYAVQSVENHACRCGPEGRDRPPDLITQAVLNAIESTGLRGTGGVRVGPAGQELLQAEELRGPELHDGPLATSGRACRFANSGRACKSCRDCVRVPPTWAPCHKSCRDCSAGRVTALENSGGVAPTADLTVNSLTPTAFVETPQLQSAAGDLQIQNALVTVRKEDGALLASFADGGISLDRDVTVAAASTLNATTADITQLTVGSTAATGAFSSNSSVTANLEVVSNLRLEAPLVRCDPTAPWLSIEGGAQGVLVNDTLRVTGGTTALEMNAKFAAVTGLGDPGGFCELAVINQAPTGVARLFLSTQNNAPAGGRGELVALANGGVQLNALNQFISLNTTSGIANLAVEPNTGGSSNGEVIFGYGHLNASDRRLKTNIRRVPEQHV